MDTIYVSLPPGTSLSRCRYGVRVNRDCTKMQVTDELEVTEGGLRVLEKLTAALQNDLDVKVSLSEWPETINLTYFVDTTTEEQDVLLPLVNAAVLKANQRIRDSVAEAEKLLAEAKRQAEALNDNT